MAGAPEVKVRISGDQKGLDDSLSKAEGSLASFAGKWPIVGAAVAAVGAAIGVFAKGAVDEAAKAELGLVRLGQSVTNAGGSFRAIAPEIERAVQKVMALSTATDDDLRDALTRMITLSGDVGGSLKNLQLVTDVAAFKQIDLGAAADIVGRAMSGQTKVLGQFGDEVKKAKDPIEALRATVGGYAEREAKTFSGALERINNQWGEFQEAVGNAILSGGEMTGMADGLAGVLGGLAGWVERNEDAFVMTRDAVVSVATALFDVGKSIYQVVQPALGPVMKVLLGALVAGLQTTALTVRTLGGIFKGLAGDTLQALGTIVEKGGALLRIFGVNVVSETGTSIREFGRNLTLSASDQIAEAQAVYKKGMAAMFGQRQEVTRATETEEAAHQRRVTRIHEDGHSERLTKAELKHQIHIENMRRANEIFAQVTAELGKIAIPEIQQITVGWDKIGESIKKAQGYMVITGKEQSFLAEGAKLVAERQKDVLEEAERTRNKFVENVDTAKNLGLAVLNVAEQFGVVKGRAAEVLGTVINVGAELVKYGFASPQGLLAVIGGLAKVVGSSGPKAAAVVQKNTEAIERLTSDLSDYNGGTSGRVFSGVTSALGGVLDQYDVNNLTAKDFQTIIPQIRTALADAGVSEADVKKLADQYGLDLKDPKAYFALLKILRTRRFGSAAGNFTDELASLEESFGVLGIEDQDDQLQAFGEFVDKHIPALKGTLGDLSTPSSRDAAVAKLKQLYRDSIAGKLAPSQYGKASPAQFRQIVGTLIDLLGGADGFLASAQAVTPSVPNLPTGGDSLGGASTAGLVGSGAVGVGLGVAGSGGVAPTLEVGGGFVHNGDNVVHINLPDIRDSQEAAEAIAAKVSIILGRKYDGQLAALGLS